MRWIPLAVAVAIALVLVLLAFERGWLTLR